MGNALEMTEIADVHRNLEMFSLDNVRMAAPAVQFDPAFHLHKVRFVIKADPSFGECHF